jgi:MerR family transcriptional regulator/heat shock protein HspR
MPRRKRQQNQKYVMISVVAERFEIHPQTLRLYEKEGLLTPVRSAGNTRLYDEDSLSRLESILFLTRELGVNLAGVGVILDLKDQIDQMEGEMERLLQLVRREVRQHRAAVRREHALVKSPPGALVKRGG